MHAQLAAERDEVLGVVAREEAAPRRALPAPPADLRHRLHARGVRVRGELTFN